MTLTPDRIELYSVRSIVSAKRASGLTNSMRQFHIMLPIWPQVSLYAVALGRSYGRPAASWTLSLRITRLPDS